MSINAKTNDVVAEDLQTVTNAVREFKSSGSIQVLTEYASKLKREGEYITQYAKEIQSDVAKDKTTLDLVKNANLKVQALLDAADNQVELAKRAILTGDKIGGSYVEQNIADVKSAIFAIVDATKTSAELAVDQVKRPISGAEKAINVPDNSEPDKTSTRKEMKSEQKTETKAEEAKDDKVEQKFKPSDADQDEKAKAEERIERTTDIKEEGVPKSETEPNAAEEMSKPKSDTNTSSDEKLEINASAKKGDAKDQGVKSDLDGPQKADVTKSKESLESSDAKSNNEPLKETNIDTQREKESKSSNSFETAPEKESTESAVQHSDSQMTASRGDAPISNDPKSAIANSDSTGTTDISHTESTIAHVEKPMVESNQDIAIDAHIIAKSLNSVSAVPTPADVESLHASSSEVGSELATAASNAAEFVHELANVIATSLFF